MSEALRGGLNRSVTDDAEAESQVPDAEDGALIEILSVLRQHFPEVDDATVVEHVNDIHKRYAAAPVRDFVPLLVEREARATLTRLTGETVPAPDQRAE
ncbi:hypothetical protein Are01nite_20450 [Actinoplanes regularis]|nr:hypothetical protein Are01nite_20450 [Actinoplanes regularis]